MTSVLEIRGVTRAEFRQEVKFTAMLFAVLEYGGNPTDPSDEATAYAERHWRRFLDKAIDTIARQTALMEVEQTARERRN